MADDELARVDAHVEDFVDQREGGEGIGEDRAMQIQGESRFHLRHRRTAHHLSLLGGGRVARPDLADDARADAGGADAELDLVQQDVAHDLGGRVPDVRRMRMLDVLPTPHDHRGAREFRQRLECHGVASETRDAEVDDRAATRAEIRLEFFAGDVEVELLHRRTERERFELNLAVHRCRVRLRVMREVVPILGVDPLRLGVGDEMLVRHDHAQVVDVDGTGDTHDPTTHTRAPVPTGMPARRRTSVMSSDCSTDAANAF